MRTPRTNGNRRLIPIGTSLMALLTTSIIGFTTQTASAIPESCTEVLSAWTPVEGVYQVTNIDRLYCLGSTDDPALLDESFLQTANLNWSARTVEVNGALPSEWSIIGTGEYPFIGIYDGGDFTVSGVTRNFPSSGGEVGVFGYVKNGLIKNLTLDALAIGGSYTAGGLAAVLQEGSVVDNVDVVGSVSSAQESGGDAWYETGGIAGRANGTGVNRVVIKNSTFKGSVTAVGTRIGGIVGYGSNLDILNVVVGSDSHATTVGITKGFSSANNPDGANNHSYGGGLAGVLEDSSVDRSTFNGTVSGKNVIGGIVGEAVSTSIKRSVVAGTVKGRAMTGGIVGWANATHISDVASSATIVQADAAIVGGGSNANFFGGIAGLIDNGGSIKRAINTGSVTGYSYVGGIAGTLVLVYSVFDPKGYGGTNGFGNVDQAYSTGTVSKTYASGIWGGVVGQMSWNSDSGDVRRTFALDTSSTYSIDRGPAGARTANPLVSAENLKLFSTFNSSFNSIGTNGIEITMVNGWTSTIGNFGPYWGICSSHNNGFPYLLKLVVEQPSGCSSVNVSPEAPYGLMASPNGSGAAEISFNLGTTYGQGTITNIEYSIDGGTNWIPRTPASLTSPIQLSGLLNGVTSTVKLRAISDAVDISSLGIDVTLPATEPGAPTELVATVRNQEMSIAFTPGLQNGPSIDNYQYSLDDGQTWQESDPAITSSPIVIAGLTNGASYSVRLRAKNSIFTGGGASSQTLEVTMATLPSAPTSLNATPGNGQVAIAFVPGFNGRSAISNYEYSVDAGEWVPFVPSVVDSSLVITGLTNGRPYSLRLRAVNGIGPSEASSSFLVTPIAPTTTTTAAVPATTTTVSSSTTSTIPAPAESVILDLPTPSKPLLTETVLVVGEPVTLEFGGFVPGEFVQLIVASTPRVIASGYANSLGFVKLSGDIPASLTAGNHSLALFAPVSGRGVRQPIAVTRSVNKQTLPMTGGVAGFSLSMYLLLLGTGILLANQVRPRRRPAKGF